MSHPALKKQSHRPWSIPAGPWKWRQSWLDLLFAHWPVPANVLKSLVPEPLNIQEFDGTSWIGIVPFRMEGVMLRPFPDLPGISSFYELNVRLYVEYNDKPGIWFLSLDATNSLAVWAARLFFYLPYYNADINMSKESGQFHYTLHRKEESMPVDFDALYEPDSEPYHAEPGSLEYFLTERYCLYAESPRGDIYRCEIHHPPWPLQEAKAEIHTNELAEPFDIPLPDTSPLLHFSPRQDVIIWNPQQLDI